jgi:hypothetical protein
MEEIWKDIKGYEGCYQISDQGRVKSLQRIVKHSKGGKKLIKERFLNQHVCKSGYYSVLLSKDGINKRVMNHILVAKTFLQNLENKRTVNHIDCNKLNNNVTNLEFLTDSENQLHALKNGIKPKGENHKNSKLKENDVIEIRSSNQSLMELSKQYNVAFQTISDIKRKKIWKHI